MATPSSKSQEPLVTLPNQKAIKQMFQANCGIYGNLSDFDILAIRSLDS
jgi:hypothetical protein